MKFLHRLPRLVKKQDCQSKCKNQWWKMFPIWNICYAKLWKKPHTISKGYQKSKPWKIPTEKINSLSGLPNWSMFRKYNPMVAINALYIKRAYNKKQRYNTSLKHLKTRKWSDFVNDIRF